jgi:hypothetical protein
MESSSNILEVYTATLRALSSESPSSFPVCVEVLTGWLVALASEDNTYPLLSAPQHNTILRAQYTWFSAPKKLNDMRSIAAETCHCTNVDETRDRWHSLGRESYRQHLASEISPLFTCRSSFWYFIHVLLRVCTPRDLPTLTRRTIDYPYRMFSRSRWPTSDADYLPHGGDDTTRGIISWLSINPDWPTTRQIYDAVINLLQGCGAYCIPYVTTSSTLIEHIVQGFQQSLALYAGSQAGDAVMIKLWRGTCEKYFRLFAGSLLWITNTLSMTQAQCWLAPHATKIFTMLLRGLDLCPTPVTWTEYDLADKLRPQLLCTLDTLFTLFPELQGGANLPPAIYDQMKSFPDFTRYDEPNKLLLYAFVTISQVHCRAPGCRVMATSLDRKRMRICGGCRVVLYCSRACQSSAWKHPAAPHRDICKILHDDGERLSGIKCEGKLVSRSPSRLPPTDADADIMHTIVQHCAAIDKWEMVSTTRKFQLYALQRSWV